VTELLQVTSTENWRTSE